MSTAIDFATLHLTSGAHTTRSDGVCLMEAAAWLAGDGHTDAPTCVSPYLRRFGIAVNDCATDARRQDLIPFISLVVGTAGDGLEGKRRWIAADHLTRAVLPKWLDRAGLPAQATAARNFTPIIDAATYHEAHLLVREIRAVTGKLRAARLDVARAAARKAIDADADADAAAYAAAYADAAADADYPRRSVIGNATYARVRAIHDERFSDLAAEAWTDTLDLYHRLITCAETA